ncbi:unnamed protein product [Mesocestoides corti]|uniref:Uncharacterized protein n=2 Tax=Mesocestoides corti TaxID=53468 RepID=A0A0R3UBA8_MESCO|nr:unnamed protein product [Mesocestoides corti]
MNALPDYKLQRTSRQTVPAELHSRQLNRLCEQRDRKIPFTGQESRQVIRPLMLLLLLLHASTQPLEVARATQKTPLNLGWEFFPHAACLPDLVQSDFHLFWLIQQQHARVVKQFKTQDDARKSVDDDLIASKPATPFVRYLGDGARSWKTMDNICKEVSTMTTMSLKTVQRIPSSHTMKFTFPSCSLNNYQICSIPQALQHGLVLRSAHMLTLVPDSLQSGYRRAVSGCDVLDNPGNHHQASAVRDSECAAVHHQPNTKMTFGCNQGQPEAILSVAY